MLDSFYSQTVKSSTDPNNGQQPQQKSSSILVDNSNEKTLRTENALKACCCAFSAFSEPFTSCQCLNVIFSVLTSLSIRSIPFLASTLDSQFTSLIVLFLETIGQIKLLKRADCSLRLNSRRLSIAHD